MYKQACLTLAVRSHELHIKGIPHFGTRWAKSWDEVSWYFLLLWGEP